MANKTVMEESIDHLSDWIDNGKDPKSWITVYKKMYLKGEYKQLIDFGVIARIGDKAGLNDLTSKSINDLHLIYESLFKNNNETIGLQK